VPERGYPGLTLTLISEFPMTYLAPVASPVPVPCSDPATAILSVAEKLQPDLAQGFQIDALRLRLEMERAFGGSDADGAWDWKLAYEAGEVALVLFLRKFGGALVARVGSPAGLLPILAKVSGLLPTHTRRSEEMERFQQFSTPLPMGLAALAAAQITPRDLVLEPSAGTGLLSILAEIAGGSLALNELADTRADLLRLLFPGRPVSTFDAAQIDDHLDANLRPSVILMNPPFSAVANVDGRSTEATARHLRSALARLAPGGRLVAITGASFAPDAPAWTEIFGHLTKSAHLVFTGAVAGAAFAKHGTSFETRVTVFDKCRGGEAGGITADLRQPMFPDAVHLLSSITAEVPPRLELDQVATASQGRSSLFPRNSAPAMRKAISNSRATSVAQPTQILAAIETEDLAYTLREVRENDDAARLSDVIYETFRLQAIDIPGAAPQPVECREAACRRDALIEKLASLPPVPGALDQIVQRFGTDLVAEVTGRSRRIVRKGDGLAARLVVESRAGSANLAEASVFMDDQKRILIFSDAGGTGRSYHADLGAKNQRLRAHYLLEPGWKADAAIQGLGRTNRTNQAQPPLFRPVATDVKAEKRFLSTIARRLDTLGAITRGQRQTGGQGLFRPEDNLESPYARDALRQLYRRIYRGDVAGCSLAAFEDATGLSLTDDNGLKDDLPPITTFLNRLLALMIDMQAVLFSAFEELLDQRIEGAIAAGVYDLGLEILRAESFRVTDARMIYAHPGSGAETQLLTILEKRRNTPIALVDALDWLDDPKARLLVNSRSGRAAVQVPATSLMLDDGTIEPRLRLIRPTETSTVPAKVMENTHWLEADRSAFTVAWTDELAEVPEFTESTLHIVSGLLLPIWKQLPQDETRVYRLQTDDGQRIIGRRVSPAWVATTLANDAPKLTAAQVHALVLEGKTVMRLAEGMELHRSRVMGVNRIELSGFSEAAKDRLKADGFFSEIISWKLRLFCPVDPSGIAILDRLLARCPVTGLHARGGC